MSLLHVSSFYSWEQRAKTLKAPANPTKQEMNPKYNSNYQLDLSKHQTMRYLTDDYLMENDELTPILSAGNDSYMGTVLGWYKLNSNLKGNVIIHTGIETDTSVSEDIQAERLPRMYLTALSQGVEKIFWYNLRAKETNKSNPEDNYGIAHSNLSPKPAFKAYKALIEMCPDNSEQPTLEINNDTYIASWRKPDKTKVTAIWTETNEITTDINYNDYREIYNYLGDKIKSKNKIIASPRILYLIGK